MSLSGYSQSLQGVMDTIAHLSIFKKIEVLDDIAWNNRNSDINLAEEFALEAHRLSHLEDNLSSRAKTANTLGIIYRKKPNYEKSIHYYDTALVLYTELENIKQQAVIHNNIANVYRAMGLPDSCKTHASFALDYARQMNDSIRITGVLTTLGNLSKDQNKYYEAFNYYKECLEIDFALGDSIYASIDLSNMADVMIYTGQYDRSYTYYQQSLKLIEGKNDLLSETITYANIGSLFQKQKQYDSALSNFKKSLSISSTIQDSIGITYSLNEIGQIYYFKSQYIIAKEYFEKSLKIASQINEITQLATARHGMGKVMVALDQPIIGLEYLKSSYELGNQINNANLTIENLESMATAYHAIGNTDKAFKTLQNYVAKNDSLNNANLLARVADLETKYDTERKEQVIAILNTQNQLQASTIERNRLIIALIAVTFIMGLGLLFIFFRQRDYKLKARFEGEKSALKSKQIKAVIETQESERKRFAMDLHDNFGQLISALRLITSQNTETKSSSDQLLDRMYSSLKNIAFDLMPTTLVQKDLVAAVEELSTQINQSGVLAIEVKSFIQKLPFSKEEEIGIYRIIQELTNNIIKYAKANKINVDFTQLDHSLQIMVSDDGIGYDPNTFFVSSNNGWKNVSSRLELIHGDLEIDSNPNSKGSTIILNIPLSQLTKAA